MTQVEQLARFVVHAAYEDMSREAVAALKGHILDAIGCAIGALDGAPIASVRATVDELGGAARVTLIGGGRTSPDRAALYNGALVRYLDFNDAYLAPGETCHPSDNLGAVLAAAEYAARDGKVLLTALAVAYQTQCRLSDEAPVRAKGFDHTTQGAYAAAAGVSAALGLDADQTANAIAISGTANNALRVTRTGRLSQWKGLAYPYTGFGATNAAFLARHGVSGPIEVFEGNKGFMESISGPFTIDWSRENLEVVRHTILKRFNAEIHSQSALEAILELRQSEGIRAADVERVELDTFDVAFNIIGGGEEGNKQHVETKEQADHSLPYMLAVALLDGAVGPPQYSPDRIMRDDVQRLLRRVIVRPDEALSRRFPQDMPCRLRVTLRDGRTLSVEKTDYEGFFARPMPWEHIVAKFDQLAQPYAAPSLRRSIADAILHLDSIEVSALTQLLAQVSQAGKERQA